MLLLLLVVVVLLPSAPPCKLLARSCTAGVLGVLGWGGRRGEVLWCQTEDGSRLR